MSKFYRINQYIKAPEVRVIDHEGAQVGIMKIEEALQKAKTVGMDLVEIVSEAKPPVVKIIDFTKFKYQESKKEKSGLKSHQDTKEIHFYPFMEENDINIRLNRVLDFIKDGNRVKLVVKFTGRQLAHKEFGQNLMNDIITRLAETASLVEAPKQLGKLLIAQIKPKK